MVAAAGGGVVDRRGQAPAGVGDVGRDGTDRVGPPPVPGDVRKVSIPPEPAMLLLCSSRLPS